MTLSLKWSLCVFGPEMLPFFFSLCLSPFVTIKEQVWKFVFGRQSTINSNSWLECRGDSSSSPRPLSGHLLANSLPSTRTRTTTYGRWFVVLVAVIMCYYFSGRSRRTGSSNLKGIQLFPHSVHLSLCLQTVPLCECQGTNNSRTTIHIRRRMCILTKEGGRGNPTSL